MIINKWIIKRGGALWLLNNKKNNASIQGFKEEIDGLQEELDGVRNQGAELMTACGEPDKPVIKKSLDEVIDYTEKHSLYRFCLQDNHAKIFVLFFQVNTAWENLNKTWKERGERLEEAMQAAVQFQDGLQVLWSLPQSNTIRKLKGLEYLKSFETADLFQNFPVTVLVVFNFIWCDLLEA